MSASERTTEVVGRKQIAYSSSPYFYLSESKFIANFTLLTVSKSMFLCHGRDGLKVSKSVSCPIFQVE